MKLERFLTERGPDWEELEALVGGARGRPQRLGAAGVLRLGTLYRGTAADLARARRLWPGNPVVAHLDNLVSRARVLVYAARPRRLSLVHFFANYYWARVRERSDLLIVAALLLLAPGVAAGTWAISDPAAASSFVPEQYRSVTEPRHTADLGLSAPEQAAFSSFIFTNNIRVSFLAFAGGLLLGLGTAYVLLLNGALLGAVTGLAASGGNGAIFTELVAPHGFLELSCIVVTAAAGLRLAAALIAPGRRRRGHALVAEGRVAVEIVLGTIPWFVAAGLVEGFVTGSGLGLGFALVVGVALAALYWMLVYRAPVAPVTDAPEPSL